MPVSRSSRSLLADVGGWLFAGAMCVTGVVYASELKAFSYQALGLTPPTFRDVASKPSQEAAKTTGARRVELQAARNGHFMTQAEINGRRIDVMVDTGASIIALTYEDAQTIGVAPLPSDFTHQVSTANGSARVALVRLNNVRIGDLLVRDAEAAVAERGKLNITLLGNSFLSKVSYRMANGRLILEE